MRGLILKDLFNLRKYGRSAFIIIILYSVLMFSMNDMSFLGGMIVLLFTMMSITSFSYDDLAKWDRYAVTLPVSRSQIVKSKYILAIMLAVIGTLFSLAMGALFAAIKKTNMQEMLLTCYILFGVAILFVSILIPLIYKFGVEKSRILIIALVAIPTGILVAFGKMFPPLFAGTLDFIIYFLPFALAAILIVSYMISTAIYGKKDL